MGSQSDLGLPTSDITEGYNLLSDKEVISFPSKYSDEIAEYISFPANSKLSVIYFEGGYIVYNHETSICQAIVYGPGNDGLIKEKKI